MNRKYPTNLIDFQFGYWKVLQKGKSIKYKNSTVTTWECLCTYNECNKIKSVRRPDLVSGKSISCGCYKAEQLHLAMITHGESIKGKETRLYGIWKNMKTRCKPSYSQRKDYYERGIAVCEEWNNNFQAFRDWSLANGYDDNKTIDRIDNALGYSPQNCRWVTREKQNQNTRRNVFFVYQGERKHLSEWARDPRCQVKLGTLKARITNQNCPFEQALTTPLKNKNITNKITFIDYFKNKIYLANGKVFNSLSGSGGFRAPLYRVWSSMKERCYNPNNRAYKNYGGRGITVCKTWIDSFDKFKDWALSQGYKDNQNWSIDRIDVNGFYSPENCRIIKKSEQVNNRRVSRKYTYAGKTKTLSEWSHDPRCQVKSGTLRARLESGWDFEHALLTPCRGFKPKSLE